MKKFLLIVLILLLGAGVFGKLQYDKAVNNPVISNKDAEIKLEVQEGEGLYNILNRLNEEKLTANIYLMKFHIRSKNLVANNIKPGKYTLPPNTSLEDLIGILNKGNPEPPGIRVTIQEGKNINEIGDILDKSGVISKNDFIKSVKEYKIPSYVKNDDRRIYALEGFLFPDTYYFKENTEGKVIIDTMINRFQAVIKEIEEENSITIEDIDRITNIAAIVEKETAVPEERGKVASVIYNRLNQNMLVQCDPTVVYALGEHKEKVLYKDLEVDSPYNTYKYKGLPAGPIASPGKESLKAALMPEKTNYIYFVGNNDGTHFFTDDYNEFLKVKKVTQGF